MNDIYVLFVETSNMNLSEINERLLSIVIPGVEYIHSDTQINVQPGMDNEVSLDINYNCIFLKTNLDEFSLNDEINEVLKTVGYLERYSICRLLD